LPKITFCHADVHGGSSLIGYRSGKDAGLASH
jgi:hypothetical protein